MGERRTLRVVAEVAGGWSTSLMLEEEYRHELDVLAGHCKDFGREAGDIRKQLGISVILGETEAQDRVKERASPFQSDLLAQGLRRVSESRRSLMKSR